MEEQRISRMYLALVKRWFSSSWEAAFPRGFFRSRFAFFSALAALVLIPSLIWYLHQHGKFHSAKQDLGVSTEPDSPSQPRPGGADLMLLTRKETIGSATPEFLSATLLPGLGMGVLQITANLPGRGEVSLLDNPTARKLSDDAPAPPNDASQDHGSLQLPWGGDLTGVMAPLGTTLRTSWHGQSITVSRSPGERSGIAEGGMLKMLPADAVQTSQSADGMQGFGEFHATSFNEHWPGKTDIQIKAQLGSHTLDLTVTARNTGSEPEPLGIGWFPRFRFPAGDREKLELRLPSGDLMEFGSLPHGLPSGRFVPAPEQINRYQGHSAPLGPAAIDAELAHLKPALLDPGASAELRDPSSGYGIRLTAAAPSIRVLHLVSKEGDDYVGIAMQSNYDDAFGKEWNGDGIATLAPGQSLEWKVRLEIFPLTRR